jgi:hypothetical protein
MSAMQTHRIAKEQLFGFGDTRSTVCDYGYCPQTDCPEQIPADGSVTSPDDAEARQNQIIMLLSVLVHHFSRLFDAGGDMQDFIFDMERGFGASAFLTETPYCMWI